MSTNAAAGAAVVRGQPLPAVQCPLPTAGRRTWARRLSLAAAGFFLLKGLAWLALAWFALHR